MTRRTEAEKILEYLDGVAPELPPGFRRTSLSCPWCPRGDRLDLAQADLHASRVRGWFLRHAACAPPPTHPPVAVIG